MNDKGRRARPRGVPEYAEMVLRALADAGLGDSISVGGGVGLLQYLDYRPTRDVDAWWGENVTPEEMQAVEAVVVRTLEAVGEVSIRRWGDVLSVELSQEGHKVFSFQVARRSARLKPLQKMPWVDVSLDSLDDLIASKMTALVERGAPRDFRDVYALYEAGLCAPETCWELWRLRQTQAGSDADFRRAYLAVLTHLERIILQRPLEKIADAAARQQAARLRRWFRDVFTGDVV